jgi:site-specific DNA-methyltransferase (adenine-specific)
VFDNPEKYKLPPMNKSKIDNGYKIIGRSENRPAIRYVRKDYPIPKNIEAICKWKIFTQRNIGTGKTGDYIPGVIIGQPGELCTETYLMIGPFENEAITINVASYIKTKFFRVLVEMKKNTQGISKDKFSFVPIQDFTRKWVDRDLYSKYDLTQEDIYYIESHIKEMD